MLLVFIIENTKIIIIIIQVSPLITSLLLFWFDSVDHNGPNLEKPI